MLVIHIGDGQFPLVAGLVRDFETVGLDILVADHVTILVNAEPVSAFIPVTPRIDGAVRLNVGVDEKFCTQRLLAPEKELPSQLVW